jgi:hypothetical protein
MVSLTVNPKIKQVKGKIDRIFQQIREICKRRNCSNEKVEERILL